VAINGILVHSDEGDELTSVLLKTFFYKICNNQLLYHPSKRLDRSYIAVGSMLEENFQFINPNIFVITEKTYRTFA